MQLKPEQLASHLAGGLAPIYLVSGDEPLQVGELLDHLRHAARAAGCTERIVINIDATFDWNLLQSYADSLSLFADKRLLDLRIGGDRLSEAGARALLDYANRPNPENVLLIATARLDAKAKRTRWYRQLQEVGITLEVWPIPLQALPAWVRARANRRGLQLTEEAARLLAERGEGNLLALAQELEKLYLVHGRTPIDVDHVLSAVADSARFESFDLVESTLLGDARRTVRILKGLQEEGVEALLALGTLAWEARALATMARRLHGGETLERLVNEQRVWRTRQQALRAALQRHPPDHWRQAVALAGRVDRIIKGLTPGDAWDGLQQLGLLICGVRLFSYNSE